MAAGVYGFVVFIVLISSGCTAGETQQLSYENWGQMLEGEWMVKL